MGQKPNVRPVKGAKAKGPRGDGWWRDVTEARKTARRQGRPSVILVNSDSGAL